MPTQNEHNEELKDDDNIIEGDELIISVEDDTPPEDRGRKPLAHDALSVDDEAIMASKAVQKRIGELRHAAHDERRAREAALRERDEAIRVAKQAADEARELKRKLQYGEHNFAKTNKDKAELSLKTARANYRSAYESGDPDQVAEAAEELARATHEAQEAGAWVANTQQTAEQALQEEQDEVHSAPSRQVTPTRQAPKPDAAAVEWAQSNDWYGKDPEMTSLAYGVHEKLVKQGIHPVRDAEEYYSEIDKAMRRRFPEYEWANKDTGSDSDDETVTAAKPAAKKTSTVAPVARSSSSGGAGGEKRRVKLTTTQVALAKKLGITPEQYAAELLKQGD